MRHVTERRITLIYAQAKNGAIGYQNAMPWHLPNDLRYFKEKTLHQTIVMGRKTFESLGKRLLPNRQSIVLTREVDYGKDIPNLIVKQRVQDVLALEQDLFIIGGRQVYDAFLPYADCILRTVIDAEFEADTFMLDIDTAHWQKVATQIGEVDAQNVYPHIFETWERRKER